MVVSSCKHCKNKHLIADNEGKMDMAQYGKKIEEFLESKGEVIQRCVAPMNVCFLSQHNTICLSILLHNVTNIPIKQ